MGRHPLTSMAEYWLWLWGDHRRARAEHMTMYVGNIDGGKYRPEDDPHPHAFVVCQVETCLLGMTRLHQNYAWHLFVDRRSPEVFRDANLEAKGRNTARIRRGIRDEFIQELAKQIRVRHYETISEAAVAEARAELRRRKAEGRSEL